MAVSLENTIFDFFSPLNVIEFKSEDDKPLDDYEFYKNLIRVYAIYDQNRKLSLKNMLNVIVTAAVPQKFLSLMAEEGYNFKEVPGRKWLRREKFGNQEIALVICELLPVEPKYYPWLLFAPTKSEAWRGCVKELILNRGKYRGLLEEATALRLKQVNEVYKELIEMAKSGKIDLSKFRREQLEAVKEIIEEERQEGNSFFLNGIISAFPTKERLADIKPEEVLANFKPEEVLAGIKPEEREVLLRLLLEQQPKQPEPNKPE